ncbi:DUF262 domain-containing HNH endonuclease family protein [Bacillus sp. JJ1609]|uniref:DUF262 domain-containing protein n=1 Tax=Bacillus sp. JJ1609 TaxID=3122977 RepID=UPI0030007224
MKIESSAVTLSELVSNSSFFQIPIYQRLYVWEEDQIKTLLEDIQSAVKERKDLYYLGGVLVVEKNLPQSGNVYDLIDGQQRFTTLWMMAIVFRDALEPFVGDSRTLRIHFAIRDHINEFFKSYITGYKDQKATPNIENALALIESFKAGLDKGEATEFARYVFENIKLILTEVPGEMDLNKLFEVINNRGVQLQHHEILKARMLNRLPEKDQSPYNLLWEACSNMNQYIEKNIRRSTGIKTQALFSKRESRKGEEALSDAGNILEAISDRDKTAHNPIKLLDILKGEGMRGSGNKVENNTLEEGEDQVRSIITFPMLLQHTLRIYLVKKQKEDIEKILDKELLRIFQEHYKVDSTTEEDVKEFIELLWRVRYFFDKHVIKWVKDEDGNEIHLISKLDKQRSKEGTYLVRVKPQSNQGTALLQSMLYHSQQITTHYWLTPYLMYIIDHKGQDSYAYLRHLDNYLLCSSEEEPLIVRTRKFLEKPFRHAALTIKELNKKSGTSFPHYWFYKLEFVLWYTLADKKGEKWKNFRMTAKNSVEHISPQTQKDTDTNTVSSELLNSLGNLALVSRSINSEYSNLPFNEKRQRFMNNNREKLDSLKMDLIYENKTWNDEMARKHQIEMIKMMNEYLGLSGDSDPVSKKI